MISYPRNVRDILKNSPSIYFATSDLKGNITYLNTCLEKSLFSSELKQSKNISFTDLITEEELPVWKKAIEDCIRKPGKNSVLDMLHEFPKEGKAMVRWEISVVSDQATQPVEIVFIGTRIDIPEDFNQELVYSHEKYKVMFDESPLPKWLIDISTTGFLDVNKAAIKQFGYSKEEILKMTIADMVAPIDRDKFREAIKIPGFFQETRKAVHRLSKKNGEILYIEINALNFELNGQVIRQSTGVDVTNRINFEKELDESRKRYQLFIEQSTEGIWRFELKKPIVATSSVQEVIDHCRNYAYMAECNDSMARMYGYEIPSQIEGLPLNSIIDLNDPNNILYLSAFVDNGFRIVDAESREKEKAGKVRYYLNNLIGTIEDGYLTRAWGTRRDITQQRLMEIGNRNLAQLVENTSDLLTSADLDFNVLTWNKAAERIYGIPAELIIGKSPRDFVDIQYPNTTREAVRSILIERGEWRGEMTFNHYTTGRPVTVLMNFTVHRNHKGNPIGFIIGGTDITERKVAQQRLEESEIRFRHMADSAPVMIWMSDTNNKTIYTNSPWVNFTGISAGANGLKWEDAVHPDDLKVAIEKFDIGFEKREPVSSVFRLRNRKGEYRWVIDTGVPRILEDGTFMGYIGSVIDITEQKTKEQLLRYQATILENVTDVIVITDLELKVTFMNKVAEKFFCIKEAEAIGKDALSVLKVELNETREETVNKLFDTGQWMGEIKHVGCQDEITYLLNTVTFMLDEKGNRSSVMVVGRNITDRKVAEEKLKQSELFYRNLIADSLDGMLITNEQGTISFATPTVQTILGHDHNAILGRNAFEFVHPDDREWAITSFNNEVTQTPELKSIVVRLFTSDGGWRWCLVRGHNLMNNPYVNGIVIYFYDDTLRKQARDQLKVSEQRFRNLISDLRLGVVLRNENGEAILQNKAVLEMFDLDEEEFLQKTIQDTPIIFIREDDSELPVEEYPVEIAMRTKKPVRDIVLGVFRKKRKDWGWLLVNSDPILDDQGNLVSIVTTFTDITERKKLEQKLISEEINKQRLITKATIDGQEKERREIGKELHDNIGQQLTTTKLYLDLAKSSADDSTAEMVILAAKSVSDVINELRRMSRSLVPPTLRDIGLIESIQDLYEPLKRLHLLNIMFYHESFNESLLSDNLKLALFRIVQEQLNNIVKYSEAGNAIISLEMQGQNVILEVSDDGKGFDMKKTRKGLGLTNILNRAQLLNGKAQVNTTPDGGCSLLVIIPVQQVLEV